jgi:hypothetical protein
VNVLLTIGRQTFLLPNSTGVENMMRVMAKAVAVYDNRWDPDNPCIEVDTDPIKVEMAILPDGVRFVRERTKEPIEVWTDGPGIKRKALPGQRLLKGWP